MSDSFPGEYIMQSGQLGRALKRVSMQVAEDLKGNNNVHVLGLNSRGYHTGIVIASYLSDAIGHPVLCHPLDAHSDSSLSAEIASLIKDNAYILLVDDVLFSGSTMMKAIRKVLDAGEPQNMKVAVIIDRGHRKFPVQPDFTGLVSPTKFREHVEVEFDAEDRPASVILTER